MMAAYCFGETFNNLPKMWMQVNCLQFLLVISGLILKDYIMVFFFTDPLKNRFKLE